MTPKLSDDQVRALNENQGFLKVEGGGDPCIVMTMQVYREMMGVGTDREFQASIQAINEGLADVEAGRTRPMTEVFQELDRKYGIHG